MFQTSPPFQSQPKKSLMENIATSTALPTTQAAIKDIFWNTNYNNKLVCNAMIDVTLAPDRSKVPTNWRNSIFRIHTKDQSYPPVLFKLDDMLPIWPHELTDMIAMLSSGLPAVELLAQLEEMHTPELLNRRGLIINYWIKI